MEQCQKKKIKFICLKCDKVFDRAKRLEDHQNKTSCGTVCTRCNHKFPYRGALEQHQKNAVPMDCSICDLKLCHQTDYNNHLRIVHQVNPLQCSICNKSFKSQQCLNDHKKNASPINCDMYNQKFCHSADYNRHKIVEHFGGAVDDSIDEEYEGLLKQKIFTVNTDLHKDKDYNEIIEINKRHIEDMTLDCI